jgi:hypothetical protein
VDLRNCYLDSTPRNVLFDEVGVAKFIVFGLSKIVEDDVVHKAWNLLLIELEHIGICLPNALSLQKAREQNFGYNVMCQTH